MTASQTCATDLWAREGYSDAVTALEAFLDGETFDDRQDRSFANIRDISWFRLGSVIRLHYRMESGFKSHDGKVTFLALSVTFTLTQEMKDGKA